MKSLKGSVYGGTFSPCALYCLMVKMWSSVFLSRFFFLENWSKVLLGVLFGATVIACNYLY